MTKLNMKYSSPAPDSDEGWENQSLPIGCGYMGVNLFGGVGRERMQVTENSMVNPKPLGGLTDFAELYVETGHTEPTGYERGLCLDDAVAYCRYTCGGVDYGREYFASYPDRVFVARFTASSPGALSLTLAPEIPFIRDYAVEEGDGGGRSGRVRAEGDTLYLEGQFFYYAVNYCGGVRLLHEGGILREQDGRLILSDADNATILFSAATNYELTPRAFLAEPKEKLRDFDPAPIVRRALDAAAARSYGELRARHVADYSALFGRVALDLGGNEGEGEYTDRLLARTRDGEHLPYLESLYFQYGRYLLISSSRKGCLPANLQGIWNCHDRSPWGSGYWHNINVQMNYWPAFVTDLPEMFESYADFNLAFRPAARIGARDYIRDTVPENYTGDEDDYGWIIGTPCYPYSVSIPSRHSGPGTGGLTSKLFWEYYDFTRDGRILRELTLPTLASMCDFLSRSVILRDGFYLSSFSASPEQMVPVGDGKRDYYHTVGCAFDQQMIYENAADFLRASALCGVEDESVRRERERIDHYRPVLVGRSGQIKEYAEEEFYGEIGEYCHRHISQLIGLFPGTVINSETPAWMDAAKLSLRERGDNSTGWALAHRLCAWARTGDGEHAYRLFHNLLSDRTMDNLWDTHPPFQIDGNFGGVAGIAEMLLQSHERYIALLPALPAAWGTGSFSGLVARGNFVFSAEWRNGRALRFSVLSRVGGTLRLRYPALADVCVTEGGVPVGFTSDAPDRITLETIPGAEYLFSNISAYSAAEAPTALTAAADADGSLRLCWEGTGPFCVSRACDNAPVYTPLARGLADNSYTDDFDLAAHDYVSYRVTATLPDGEGESDGAVLTVPGTIPNS